MGRGEHRFFQFGRSSSFALCATYPAGVHSFCRRLEHAGSHRPVAVAGKNQPRQHPRNSTMRRDFVKALEHALDVRFLRTRPSFEELRLKIRDAPDDHRFDQTFAAAEVMEDRGMRDADVGSDFLKPDCLRTAVEKSTLCSFQDSEPSLRSAPAPSSRRMDPGANDRLSRSGWHLLSERQARQLRLPRIRRDAAHRSEASIETRDASRPSP